MESLGSAKDLRCSERILSDLSRTSPPAHHDAQKTIVPVGRSADLALLLPEEGCKIMLTYDLGHAGKGPSTYPLLII